MRVEIRFDDIAGRRTEATVTRWPSWFARLLRKRPQVTRVRLREGVQSYLRRWFYVVDNTDVDDTLNDLLNERRRWVERQDLPIAYAEEKQRA